MRPLTVLAGTASLCAVVLAAGSASPVPTAAVSATTTPAHVVRTHLDDPPAGVDVHAHVATAALVARSGVSAHRAVYRVARTHLAPHGARIASGTRTTVSVLSVPGGAATLGGLAEHVSPSCTGTTDGDRVQVVFVREASTPSRYADLLPSLRSFVADVDDTFAVSSPTSGRRVRWVQDGTCVPVLPEVVLADGALTGNQGLNQLVPSLQAAGYGRADRKYLAFADASALCGIGQMVQDDDPTSNNANNGVVAQYARVDTACWSVRAGGHSTPAHELTHMLGAVQPGAPHATVNGHCTDEDDALCYDDGSGAAVVTRCAAAGDEGRLDCGHDDYFDDAPASSGYLAGAWNTARSAFLDAVPVLGAPSTGAVTTPPATTTSPPPATVTPAATAPVPVVVAVAAPASTYVGVSARVSTSVSAATGPVATGVQLQGWTPVTGWRVLATTTTSSTGKAAFVVRRTTPTALTLRVVVPATAAVARGLSSSRVSRFVKRPTATLASVRAGRPDVLAATVRTNALLGVGGQYVSLQVRYAGTSTWRSVTRRMTDRLGRVTFAVQPRRKVAYRWVYPGAWNLAPSTSTAVSVSF
ncbi:MAG: hypothetical protein ABIV05_08280 [Actinomycetota bacterium]